MNFFEQELRKLANLSETLCDARFVGRACFAHLGDDLRVKVEFVTQGTIDDYEALKATVINRNDGPVDSIVILFADLLGTKAVDKPNFKDGITPYIWAHTGKAEWYAYKPAPADYEQIAAALDDYIGLFMEMEQGMEQSM